MTQRKVVEPHTLVRIGEGSVDVFYAFIIRCRSSLIINAFSTS